jgi:hypothetical protein
MRKISFLIVLIALIACKSSNEKNIESKNSLADTGNVIHIKPDSCSKWGLPNTDFTLTAPEGYIVEYFADKTHYLRLRKYDNKVLTSEITIGKLENIKSDEEAMAILNEIEPLLKLNLFLDFVTVNKGFQTINSKSYPILSGTMNYDEFESDLVKGNWCFNDILIRTKSNNIQGVNIAFSHSTMRKKTNALTKTELTFLNNIKINE